MVSRVAAVVLLTCTAIANISYQVLANAASAMLPEKAMEIPQVDETARIIRVAEGESLQEALDSAQPGDVIELTPNAFYHGPFILPAKTGNSWITIRSGSSSHALPPPGVRITPEDAPLLAKLVSAEGSVIKTAPGAHHYHFIGLEIHPWGKVFLHNLVDLGAPVSAASQIPHHIIFDRVYLHGDSVLGARRGIALNSASTAVINSWLVDFKMRGEDSQAIAGWDGPGPYLIRNNHLEAAGENIMFGGADPLIRNSVPADIQILGNRFTKPLAWRSGTGDHDGSNWTIKNLLELKNARRVLIEGNLFEHNWVAAQDGFAILFTVRNQNGRAPWSVVEDVTFANNIVRRVASGIKLLGNDDLQTSESSARITIHNNVFEEIGEPWGSGRLFQVLDGVEDLSFTNNSAANSHSILMAEGRVSRNMSMQRNIFVHNEYGIIGTGTGIGKPSLLRYFPGSNLQDNVFIGGSSSAYPAQNHFLTQRELERFTATARGQMIGADMTILCAALSSADQLALCPSH